MKWEELPLADRAKLMAAAVKNGYTDIRSIKLAYANFLNLKLSTGNMYSKGGDTDDTYEPEVVNPLDNLPEWKALENIDYVAIPDPEFTREKTGAGSIEYFSAEEPEGITYPNGYHRDHPMPGKDVILYNPNDNDEQDIRLDALHIMPKDPTYDALNTIYRNASLDARDDNYINAIDRYTTDKAKQAIRYIVDRTTGKDTNDKYYGTDPFMLYFNNEADGTLRSLFMEGDENYRESKRYHGNKNDIREWNAHLMPYINDIQRYLETGERPPHVLPNLEVTDQMAYGGNLFDGVSGTSKMKKKSRSSAGGLSIPDYQRKKAAYYRNELIKRGITNPVHLDAIIANMAVESSFNPGANDGTGAHGLMLWMGSRIPKDMSEKGLLDYIAKTYNHFGGNDWLNKEAYKRFNTTNDPVEAANLMRIYWERCAPLYHYRAGAWLNLYNNNGGKSTIDTYHPMQDITWDDVQARRKLFELTPQEEALLNSTPNTSFNVDYTDWNNPKNKKTFEEFYAPFALDESLYKNDSTNNLMFLFDNMLESQQQDSNDSYTNFLADILTANTRTTPKTSNNDALYRLFAPYGDGGHLYHGLNFAAYSKPNKFGEGGPYNDKFMKDYGYRWVPASEILLSDPYFNDIQQHDSNGMYAVDEKGFYVPASRIKKEWQDYVKGSDVNGPATGIDIPELVHEFDADDQRTVDIAKRLWGDNRFYAYRDLSDPNSGFFTETINQLDWDDADLALERFSPNNFISKMDTLTKHSTTPAVFANELTSIGGSRMRDGRLRASTWPTFPGAPIFLDEKGRDFLDDYVAEFAHTYQYNVNDDDVQDLNLVGESGRVPVYVDGTYYSVPYEDTYRIPGFTEYNAHKGGIEQFLRYYLFDDDNTYERSKDKLFDLVPRHVEFPHRFKPREYYVPFSKPNSTKALGGTLTQPVNKFDGESGSNKINGKLITLSELPPGFVEKYADMPVTTPSGRSVRLYDAAHDYGGTHVYTNDVPHLTDYLLQQDLVNGNNRSNVDTSDGLIETFTYDGDNVVYKPAKEPWHDDAILLDEITKIGYKPLVLDTYYPVVSDYPWTGHSALSIPLYNYGIGYPYEIYTDRRMDDEDYNILKWNCADATKDILNYSFNKNEKPLFFTTPGDIQDFAINELGGLHLKGNRGRDRVLIPVTEENVDSVAKRALDFVQNYYKDRLVEDDFTYASYYPDGTPPYGDLNRLLENYSSIVNLVKSQEADTLSASELAKAYEEAIGNLNTKALGGPLILEANKFGDGGFYKLPEWKAWYRSMNTDTPYSNYEDAIDMDDSLALKIKQALDKGVSNCTLTVSQFFNPNRPIARARTIVSNPIANGFYEVDEDHVVPGTMVIASHPDMKDDDPNLKYHTMIISGFAPQDDVYKFRDGTLHEVKKGEPFVNYSRGKSSSDNYVFRVPLSVYNKKSEGKTRNRYYRPIDQRYPEVMLDNIDVVYKK